MTPAERPKPSAFSVRTAVLIGWCGAGWEMLGAAPKEVPFVLERPFAAGPHPGTAEPPAPR
jgi:hypothetical protein